MEFSNLEEASDAFNKLRDEMEVVVGVQAGLTSILSALIVTHPNYEQFQLFLTSVIEKADAGSFSEGLTEKQRVIARGYAETLQQLIQLKGKIDPLRK